MTWIPRSLNQAIVSRFLRILPTGTLNDAVIPARAGRKSSINPEEVTEIDIRWEPGKKAIRLEMWKYDPCLFMRNGTVDPASPAMSFENNADERIEGAIEEVPEGYQS